MHERRNRLIRWLIIAVSLALLFPACYPDPWTPEGAVSETLRGMSIPADTVRAVSVIDTGGLYSVLFYDEQHRIYHHFLMDRPVWLPLEKPGRRRCTPMTAAARFSTVWTATIR
jgi:hypothetical protein